MCLEVRGGGERAKAAIYVIDAFLGISEDFARLITIHECFVDVPYLYRGTMFSQSDTARYSKHHENRFDTLS